MAEEMRETMAAWAPRQLEPWLAHLRAGGVAAAPAEGVYGYVADPFNPQALQNVLELKKRNPGKGFIVLVRAQNELEKLVRHPLPPAAAAAIAACWKQGQPPTTLILPAHENLPQFLTGGMPTIAVRLPAAPYMRAYLKAFGGPLVSTSLNVSGQPAATRASQIPAGVPALTLEGELSGRPSRIFNPLESVWLRG